MALPEWFLRIVGHLMNRFNAKMNAFALQLLDARCSDRVLEIGFGGGVNLRRLLERGAFLAGVDRSAGSVRRARARFAAEIAAGRADFREGTVEALPFDAAAFDGICTVNRVYFWKSLDQGCGEIARVLAPGGRAVVGFLPEEWMDRGGFPADLFTSREPRDLVASMVRAGLREVSLERPAPATRWNVLVAQR